MGLSSGEPRSAGETASRGTASKSSKRRAAASASDGGGAAVGPAAMSPARSLSPVPHKAARRGGRPIRAPSPQGQSISPSVSPKRGRWRSASPPSPASWHGRLRSFSPGSPRRLTSPGSLAYRNDAAYGSGGGPMRGGGGNSGNGWPLRGTGAAPRWVTDASLRPDARQRLEALFTRGLLHAADLDPACMDFLEGLPGSGAMQVLDEFSHLDLYRIRNPTAFLIGICKRVASRLHPPLPHGHHLLPMHGHHLMNCAPSSGPGGNARMGGRREDGSPPPPQFLRRRQGLGHPMLSGSFAGGPGPPHGFGMMHLEGGAGGGFGPRFSHSRSRSPLRYAPGRSPGSRMVTSRSPPPRSGRVSPRYSRSPRLRYGRSSPRYSRSPRRGDGGASRSPRRGAGAGSRSPRRGGSRSPRRGAVAGSRSPSLPRRHTASVVRVAAAAAAAASLSSGGPRTGGAVPSALGGSSAQLAEALAASASHHSYLPPPPPAASTASKRERGAGESSRKSRGGGKDAGSKDGSRGVRGSKGVLDAEKDTGDGSGSVASGADESRPAPLGRELLELFKMTNLVEPQLVSEAVPSPAARRRPASSSVYQYTSGAEAAGGLRSGSGALRLAVLQIARLCLARAGLYPAKSAGQGRGPVALQDGCAAIAQQVADKVLDTLPDRGAGCGYNNDRVVAAFLTPSRRAKIEQLTDHMRALRSLVAYA